MCKALKDIWKNSNSYEDYRVHMQFPMSPMVGKKVKNRAYCMQDFWDTNYFLQLLIGKKENFKFQIFYVLLTEPLEKIKVKVSFIMTLKFTVYLAYQISPSFCLLSVPPPLWPFCVLLFCPHDIIYCNFILFGFMFSFLYPFTPSFLLPIS